MTITPLCHRLLLIAVLSGAAAGLKSLEGCRRDSRLSHISRVCDPHRVVDVMDMWLIQNRVERLESTRVLQCGMSVRGPEVIVAISNATMTEQLANDKESVRGAIRAQAHEIHEKVGAGSGACGSGLVLLVSVPHRYTFLSTSGDMKRLIPRAVAENIVQQMRPHMQAQEYTDGIVHALSAIERVLVESGSPSPEAAARAKRAALRDSVMLSLVLGALGGGIAGVCWCARREAAAFAARTKAWQRCKQQLAALEAARDARPDDSAARDARPDDSAARDAPPDDSPQLPLAARLHACPVCLNDFEPATGAYSPSVTLACRHRFHTACVRTATAPLACPICAPSTPTNVLPSASETSRDEEFVLHRMAALYPAFISATMERDWCAAARAAAGMEYSEQPAFLCTEPRKTTPARGRDSGGVSGGGGSGFSGGGGSW